jgi:hypothetical protein
MRRNPLNNSCGPQNWIPYPPQNPSDHTTNSTLTRPENAPQHSTLTRPENAPQHSTLTRPENAPQPQLYGKPSSMPRLLPRFFHGNHTANTRRTMLVKINSPIFFHHPNTNTNQAMCGVPRQTQRRSLQMFPMQGFVFLSQLQCNGSV